MKYIACIRPNGSLSEKLEKESKLAKTSSGLYCALWEFNTFGYYQNDLFEILSEIKASSFSTRVFSGEKIKDPMSGLNSYALLLLKNPEFCRLHEQILKISRDFDQEEDIFGRMEKQIGHSRYNPHITLPGIAKSDELKNDYAGKILNVFSYEIMNKKGTWKT